jgi:hypothetical protein
MLNRNQKPLYRSGAPLLIIALLAIALLAAQGPERTQVAAATSAAAMAAAHPFSPGKAEIQTGATARTVTMAQLPAIDLARAVGVTRTFAGPGVLTGRSAATWAQLNAADRSKRAPRPDESMGGGFAPASSSSMQTQTPYGGPGFKGLDDSCNAAVLGVELPAEGLAVASSSSNITEVVNDCIAVYSPTGVLQPGFPKSLQTFFGVPAPVPAGCASDTNNQPWLDSSRAFYDFNDNRFWVAALQTEGTGQVSPTCTEVSKVWFAVSASSDPLGAWHVYHINTLGVVYPITDPTAAANFLQFAFGPDGVYWSVNMFDQTGAKFEVAAYYGTGKARFEAGLTGKYFYLQGPAAAGIPIDTLEPVMNETPAYGPRGELFVNTFNINGDVLGSNCITQVCSWAVVTLMSNAGPWGDDPNCPGSGCAHTEPIVSGTYLANIRNYFLPGGATQPPNCRACVATGDTRISATPIYAHGEVYAAISTGLFNPHDDSFDNAILWTQFHVTTSEQDPSCTFAGDICPKITAASQEMGWYFYFNGGDISAYYPALMTDGEGNLCMVYAQSSSTVYRSAYYTCRRDSFQSGLFRDPGRPLQAGTVSLSSSIWGSYFAASYDGQGPGLDHPIFCGQYAGVFAGKNDWGTWCARVSFQLKYG